MKKVAIFLVSIGILSANAQSYEFREIARLGLDLPIRFIQLVQECPPIIAIEDSVNTTFWYAQIDTIAVFPLPSYIAGAAKKQYYVTDESVLVTYRVDSTAYVNYIYPIRENRFIVTYPKPINNVHYRPFGPDSIDFLIDESNDSSGSSRSIDWSNTSSINHCIMSGTSWVLPWNYSVINIYKGEDKYYLYGTQYSQQSSSSSYWASGSKTHHFGFIEGSTVTVSESYVGLSYYYDPYSYYVYTIKSKTFYDIGLIKRGFHDELFSNTWVLTTCDLAIDSTLSVGLRGRRVKREYYYGESWALDSAFCLRAIYISSRDSLRLGYILGSYFDRFAHHDSTFDLYEWTPITDSFKLINSWKRPRSEIYDFLVRGMANYNASGILHEDSTYYHIRQLDDTTVSMYKFFEVFSYAFNEGWNLVSYPFRDTLDVPVAFPSALSDAYIYNPSTTNYDSCRLVTSGTGFWLLSHTTPFVDIDGKPNADTISFTLNRGWNLIGSPSHTISASALSDLPEILGDIYTWDAITASYLPTDSLEPGKGYWVLSRDTLSVILH